MGQMKANQTKSEQYGLKQKRDVIDITKDKTVSMRSKITNGSSCVIHGNGPGVILWRSLVKQVENKGNLYVDDYVLRVGVDFFHWILWWIIMPCERLSHWLSITYGFDLGFHSTTFSEEVIWRFHVWTFVALFIILGIPIIYWYKYHFKTTMKMKRNESNDKNNKTKSKSKERLPITQQLVKGLVNLEIMVHHNGNTFPLLKTQKKS